MFQRGDLYLFDFPIGFFFDWVFIHSCLSVFHFVFLIQRNYVWCDPAPLDVTVLELANQIMKQCNNRDIDLTFNLKNKWSLLSLLLTIKIIQVIKQNNDKNTNHDHENNNSQAINIQVDVERSSLIPTHDPINQMGPVNDRKERIIVLTDGSIPTRSRSQLARNSVLVSIVSFLVGGWCGSQRASRGINGQFLHYYYHFFSFI